MKRRTHEWRSLFHLGVNCVVMRTSTNPPCWLSRCLSACFHYYVGAGLRCDYGAANITFTIIVGHICICRRLLQCKSFHHLSQQVTVGLFLLHQLIRARLQTHINGDGDDDNRSHGIYYDLWAPRAINSRSIYVTFVNVFYIISPHPLAAVYLVHEYIP